MEEMHFPMFANKLIITPSTWSFIHVEAHSRAHVRTQTPEHSKTLLSVYISRDSHTVRTVIQLVICTTLIIIYFDSAHLAHC